MYNIYPNCSYDRNLDKGDQVPLSLATQKGKKVDGSEGGMDDKDNVENWDKN